VLEHAFIPSVPLNRCCVKDGDLLTGMSRDQDPLQSVIEATTPLLPVDNRKRKGQTPPPRPDRSPPFTVTPTSSPVSSMDTDQLHQIMVTMREAVGAEFVDIRETIRREMAEMRADYGLLKDKVCSLEQRIVLLENLHGPSKPQAPGAVVATTTPPLIDLGPSSMDKRRDELLREVRKKCEVLVLGDSLWNGADMRAMGAQLDSFVYSMRCSTLAHVPTIVPKLVPEIDPNLLKSIVISTGVNDVEHISSAMAEPQRRAELDKRIGEAIAAVKAAWPGKPVFLDFPHPLLNSITTADLGKPRFVRPACAFAEPITVESDGVFVVVPNLVSTVDDGVFTDVSVYYADGKHLAKAGQEVKITAIISAVLPRIRRGSTVRDDLRYIFRELSQIKTTRAVQSANPQASLAKVAEALSVSASTIVKMLESGALLAPPPMPPWGRARGYLPLL
jgi:hypothetical protein